MVFLNDSVIIKGGIPMVSSVQMYNGSQVSFRAKEDIINSPGKFSASVNAPQKDVVELSSQDIDAPEKKKRSIGKTIAKLVGGVLVLGAAAWGIYYSKGAKWINKNAVTTTEKVKNILAKPGEWIDENIIKKFHSGNKSKTKDLVDEIELEDIVESAENLAK